MMTAILIIVLLGALDAMLVLACMELEKEIDDERSNSKADK